MWWYGHHSNNYLQINNPTQSQSPLACKLVNAKRNSKKTVSVMVFSIIRPGLVSATETFFFFLHAFITTTKFPECLHSWMVRLFSRHTALTRKDQKECIYKQKYPRKNLIYRQRAQHRRFTPSPPGSCLSQKFLSSLKSNH